MIWGYISPYKLETERSNIFPLSISLKTKAKRANSESLGLENIPQVPGNWPKNAQNNAARKAISVTFLALKQSGAKFRPKSSKPSVQIFFLCPFHWKPKASRASLESLGLENISQVPGNRPKVGQNHAARRAVSATFSALKWSGAIFRPRSWKASVQIFFLCPFCKKPRPSRATLESLRLENISQVPGNWPKNAQNNATRKAISATFLALKQSGAKFRPRSSKPSVQIFFLCPFHWKSKPSRASLESLGLKIIPQAPGNRPKVGQNHAARKAVSATFSALKWSGAIFRPRSWKASVQIFFLSPFY